VYINFLDLENMHELDKNKKTFREAILKKLKVKNTSWLGQKG